MKKVRFLFFSVLKQEDLTPFFTWRSAALAATQRGLNDL
jgi:hypothetical protein